MNGSSDLAHKPVATENKVINERPVIGLAQKPAANKDIGQENINPYVWKLANPVSESPNWPRSDKPYDNNGTSKKAFKPLPIEPKTEGEKAIQAIMQRTGKNSTKDMSEKEVDPDVHAFANPNTETLNWPRKETPYDYNGSSDKAHPPQQLAPTAGDSLYPSSFSLNNWAESQQKLYDYQQLVQGPSDLNFLEYRNGPMPKDQMYDANDDGIEDNMRFSSADLDKFYIPNRFFPTEYIYNTRHGELPGHRQKTFFDS